MNTMQFLLLMKCNAVMEEAESSFAHDHAGVNADIYTMAKGMGNGFLIGGILIAPHINQNMVCWAQHSAAIIWLVPLHWLCWK